MYIYICVRVSGAILPVTFTATAATLKILGVVWMEEDLNRLPTLHDTVTPAVGHVECNSRLTIGVYVPIAAIHHSIRATVLVVELSVGTNFIAKLVRT
jgi:predicted secreted protein